jgi:phosphoribosylglycinamide formyltransferase-1
MFSPRLAFLVSRNGTNARSIVNACRVGVLNADPVLLISNNKHSKALQWVTEYDELDHMYSRNEMEHLAALIAYRIDWIILCGYLSRVGNSIIDEYEKRIVNVHPSLLPRHGGKGMYGRAVHESVISSGDKWSGFTVHYVSKNYDEGEIIYQKRIRVLPNESTESLEQKVRKEEQMFLPHVLSTIL